MLYLITIQHIAYNCVFNRKVAHKNVFLFKIVALFFVFLQLKKSSVCIEMF